MLSEPKTLDPKQRDAAKKRDAGQDDSADFIHELAESGTASELGTVKAASDAAEKDEGRDPRKDRAGKA